MSRPLIAIAFAITLVTHFDIAHAGPFCGRTVEYAPAVETTLPLAPTISMWVEDFYYGGKRKAIAEPPAIRATIDGDAVSLKITDVRAVDGLIRYVKINSRKAGELKIFAEDVWSKKMELGATYTTSKDWTVSDKPTVTLTRGRDARLGPYNYKGELAVLTLDVPAIGFSLRWRTDRHSQWIVRRLPGLVEEWPSETKRSEARLGQTMCGMIDNVPLRALEAGIEVELTAMLPNGRTVRVTEGLASPLAIPPTTEAQRDADERDRQRQDRSTQPPKP